MIIQYEIIAFPRGGSGIVLSWFENPMIAFRIAATLPLDYNAKVFRVEKKEVEIWDINRLHEEYREFRGESMDADSPGVSSTTVEVSSELLGRTAGRDLGGVCSEGVRVVIPDD